MQARKKHKPGRKITGLKTVTEKVRMICVLCIVNFSIKIPKIYVSRVYSKKTLNTTFFFSGFLKATYVFVSETAQNQEDPVSWSIVSG
jgi:hypothetical protein